MKKPDLDGKEDVYKSKKEQEKTQYGPPIFGKVLADKAPNGTSRAPRFNYKSIED